MQKKQTASRWQCLGGPVLKAVRRRAENHESRVKLLCRAEKAVRKDMVRLMVFGYAARCSREEFDSAVWVDACQRIKTQRWRQLNEHAKDELPHEGQAAIEHVRCSASLGGSNARCMGSGKAAQGSYRGVWQSRRKAIPDAPIKNKRRCCVAVQCRPIGRARLALWLGRQAQVNAMLCSAKIYAKPPPHLEGEEQISIAKNTKSAALARHRDLKCSASLHGQALRVEPGVKDGAQQKLLSSATQKPNVAHCRRHSNAERCEAKIFS